ncbi:hypothetical protein SELMODRAFT_130298 [Selaginella moellendorffii]|uniref:non-specific serine/threonine protein kinase n=1 Tax=Selaginella moellendorffii TaxID=88036 RepID=D8T298_SELML|nr:integrin-linked protein kinase 1 [Selaginella moellendorffii]EFJ09171.1 hypothetical protein SELMODRAFT_130298 [Selaginella moellendorffii]|eukprot:XP_002989694.1 integrin-linked protein kinase 1 [Selaginella moellendorffii]
MDELEEKKGQQLLVQLLSCARNNDAAQLGRLLRADPALVHAKDYDGRTALHIAALHGGADAARLLLAAGANVNATDRWGNSPLTDAEAAGFGNLVRLIQDYGGQLLTGNSGVTPPTPRNRDWEIDPSEIDLRHSTLIGKGSFGEIRKVVWRGTPVAAKTILPSLCNDRMVVEDFRYEVQLLVKLRHPNIVQFLGAVTKKPPLMLITEFLPKGDLHRVLREKRGLHSSVAINFALDIARGMAYLHRGPNVIIHRDLKPRNIIMDEGSELKVGDFGLSKLIRGQNPHDFYKLTGETGSYRYMAPEVFKHDKYDKSVDVFSFGMILYEMFEGNAPFFHMEPYSAASTVADGERPSFKAKGYTAEMKELIENCWQDSPALRPSFPTIIERLERLQGSQQGHHHHHWPFAK